MSFALPGEEALGMHVKKCVRVLVLCCEAAKRAMVNRPFYLVGTRVFRPPIQCKASYSQHLDHES